MASEDGMQLMAFEAYCDAVAEGRWPESPRVPLPPAFVNDAGEIQNLLLHPAAQSTAIIKSHARAVRANHFHKTDWHFAYVVSGALLYFERAVGDVTISAKPLWFGTGSMFFTPPMREHAMLFTQETAILTMARNVRSHAAHEEDVVRVEYVTPDVAPRYL